jgi:hypothetical protein
LRVAVLAGEFAGSGIGVPAHNQNQTSIQDGRISDTLIASRCLLNEITNKYKKSRYAYLVTSSNSIIEFNASFIE